MGEHVGGLAVGQAGVLVQVGGLGLGPGPDLAGGRPGGVTGLAGVAAAQAPAALPAVAAVDAEAAVQRPGRQLDLVLGILMGFDHAATMRAGGVQVLVAPVVGQGRAMAVGAVPVAGLAAGGLGGALGEGRGLAPDAAQGLFQGARQLLPPGPEAFDLQALAFEHGQEFFPRGFHATITRGPETSTASHCGRNQKNGKREG